ncbi:DNA-binding NarL/FixJ family response regulator [Phytomonospora endophytica]|uniref:DNA-binding NarL/FixJ family response regulator n=1 Tax=Phytomonospora endophytica TaxID=714109 RepID=A0A841FUX9_9ACTN|nr:DNA-binding NarL/FixJ family response regulator [Phytomonospora endophytica]GIG69285.1 hypothetical protein Pen01_55800 [Phytomonospora endophytica]
MTTTTIHNRPASRADAGNLAAALLRTTFGPVPDRARARVYLDTLLTRLAAAGVQPSHHPPPTGQTRRGRTLTERELQTLTGMAEGKTNAAIGRELSLAEETIKTHAVRLFRKIGARDRAHAVAIGFRDGLLA